MGSQERLSTFEDIQVWRQQLVQSVLRAVVIVGLPAVVVGVYDAYETRVLWVIPFYVVAYAVAGLTTFLRRVSFAFQAWVILGVVYVVGVLDLASSALTGDALPYLIALPFLSVIFFGRRQGVLALVVVVLTMGVFGWLFSTGRLVVSLEKQASSATPVRWLSGSAALLMLGILLVNAQHHLQRCLTEALTQSRRLAREEEQRLAVEQEQREHLQAMVTKYMAFVSGVAEGDLTGRLSLDGDGLQNDALVVLGLTLNEMVNNLQGMTMRIKDVAQNLTLVAGEILAATAQQALGANEQSAAIAQTTTTVDELKTVAEQSVVRAQEVASASQRTFEVSRTGWQAVGKTIDSIAQTRTRVEGIAENILALSEQTQQVGEIIDTVNDIAAQSNILALNASVEAARAGEYGKGFAVVAVEVRNLAEQSRQATAQVRVILSDIQKATNTTVMATEEGTKQVEEGVELASQAGGAIEQLASVIEESAQAATQMVAGGRQQAAGVEQIAVAMQNIKQVTVQSLESTRQAEKAVRDLNELARSLNEILEQYQL
jgi:methyl-accepting chemotaxis protein